MSRRYLIVGDVHGMFEALSALVASFRPRQDDVLVFVGDLVDKGPDSAAVVRFVRELAARYEVVLVEGNHEEKHRRFRRTRNMSMIGAEEMASITDELSTADVTFLETAVPFYRIPEHGVLVVHAGIPANMSYFPASLEEAALLTGKEKRHFARIQRTRYVDAVSGEAVTLGEEKEGDPFWADIYDGRFGFVVFGHEPLPEVTFFPYAAGIDTGAYRGGALSALVYGEGTPYVLAVRTNPMKEAVVVVTRRGDRFLGVSRRDDPSAFGLPGGKVDPGETASVAARRELFEETGLRAGTLTPFFQQQEGNFLVTAFLTTVSGAITPQTGETGVVAWVDRETLCSGTFGAFNALMFDALDDRMDSAGLQERSMANEITVADVAELMERHAVPSRLRSEFMRGLEVEWEHAATVGYDLDVISQIVCDHLAEDPRYYAKLRRMHRENPIPEAVDFARYEEHARGLSDDQIQYALQDILDTLPSADSIDRLYGTAWQGGKYRDQASVLRRELQRRQGVRQNPQRKRWPRSSEVQSLIFDRDMFTPRQAQQWARQHDFAATAVDKQANTLRIRQVDPEAFDRTYGFRTIRLTDGVQATVGVPLA
jgi:ADP-ribose pyrophosphatase YjhB (NUDIX family)